MLSIKKFVTSGVIAVVVAFSLSMPGVADAADRTIVKKRAHVTKARAAHPSSRTERAAKARRAVVTGKASRTSIKNASSIDRVEATRVSFGQRDGLHNTADALDLKSSVALVLDADTNEVLFSKNSTAVLPIASLTKLMTALVVIEASLPMQEPLTVSQDDVDTEKGSRSRLRVGTTLSREEMLHLALMSSENRAAHALGRAYPGGMTAFVAAMNAKAAALGMHDTRYVEPTGLSSLNQSSARDLALLVHAVQEQPVIRDFSTSSELAVEVGNRTTQFRTTNALVRSPTWDIALQKTGYISEAGRCLVMQAKMAGRKLIMVFLDSAGKYSRIGDAERVRRWVSELPTPLPTSLIANKSVL